MNEIQIEIYVIDEQLAVAANNYEVKSKLDEKRGELLNYMNNELLYEANASQIQSKIQWAEEGEKNTAFFLSLEKSRQRDNVIEKIERDGIAITNGKDILDEIKKFY